jgi:hypothetical protein
MGFSSETTFVIDPRVNFEQTAVAWHSVFFWFVEELTGKEYIEHYYVKVGSYQSFL